MLICDVGPRDGLQNERVALSPSLRTELCTRLAEAGLRRIEAASFVSDRRVPQMAGAEQVIRGLAEPTDACFAALVLSRRGFDRAVASGAREIHYAFPVTEEYARRNQGAGVVDCIKLARELALAARSQGIYFTVTLSAAFGCPFEGRVDTLCLESIAEALLSEPPNEICLADSIGVAVPTQVKDRVGRILRLGVGAVGCHFHNTRNTGLANSVAAIEAGAAVLDAAIGGIGGCPFAPNATGNIATEDLVYLLEGMGIPTGLDLPGLLEVSGWLSAQLHHEMPSMLARAGTFAGVGRSDGQAL